MTLTLLLFLRLVSCQDDFIGTLYWATGTTYQDSTIDCPNTVWCTVECSDYQSCRNLTINCPSDWLCEVYCTNLWSCLEMTINGPSAAYLEVRCDQQYSCLDMTINGGNNSFVSVACDQTGSCHNAVIDAGDTNKFLMTGCSSDDSCIGLNITCPPNIDGVPQCTFFCMYWFHSFYFVVFRSKWTSLNISDGHHLSTHSTFR